MQEKRKKKPKLKFFSIYTHVSRKDEDMIIMSMKPFTEIVKYMSTWSGVLALGWGQLKKLFTLLYISCTCGGRGGGVLKENDYIIMFTWKFPSKIVNVMFPCVSVLTLRQGQIGAVVFKHMYTIIF